MSERHSTASDRPGKPAKPYPDFPLFAHAAGVWAKKIRGKLHYFGPWDNPQAALDKYLAEREALHAGRKPKADPGALTIKDLVNAFLNHKSSKLEPGELSPVTWRDYKAASDLLIDHFGRGRLVADLGPDDFPDLRNKLSKRWGPVRVRDVVQRIRSVFKYGYENGLLAVPVRFGSGFALPSQKTMRMVKAQKGPLLFSASEIGRMLAAAGVQLRAMLLLGINAGFGNADVGTLPIKAVDLAGGWIDYPRPKTGIPRRCKLWPETVEAIKAALAVRPEPKEADAADLVFITKYRHSWAKDSFDNPVSKETKKLLHALGINGRKGRGFYTLRHVFRTVADEMKDQPAIDFVMGHKTPGMASVYRERISDERLKAVAEHVRTWLFSTSDKSGEEE